MSDEDDEDYHVLTTDEVIAELLAADPTGKREVHVAYSFVTDLVPVSFYQDDEKNVLWIDIEPPELYDEEEEDQ